jgi:hypothetical protein
MEWFKNIPTTGILCKCKTNKNVSKYKIDIITRYNDQLNSEFRFKTIDSYFVGYADAIPMSAEDAKALIYTEESYD